jgi:hypothetical protein
VPLLYAMSRSFYIEFALAALVALSLYLLLASKGFQQRGAALGFGLALGLGMLTKRTYPVFIAVPAVFVILRSSVPRSLWDRLRGGAHVSFPDLLIALGSAVALAGLWYFPNRTQADELTLGLWLFVAWVLLIAWTIYLVLRRPKDAGVNCLSALSLGATIASIWYLPRVEAIRRMLLYGYGLGDPRGRTLDLGSIYTYTYYFRHMTNEGLGLILSCLLAVVLVGSLFWLLRKGCWREAWQANTGWWVLFLWPVAAYLLLTLSIYKEARAFAPVLPALALILAAGLLRIPWRWVKRTLLGLTLVWGLVQFAVVSYAEFNAPAQKTQFWSDVLGNAGLFARGDHIELPDAGPTDPGYHIQPDVLVRVDARRRLMERESVRLGVLAQTPQINAGSFLYSTLTRYEAIEVTELARNYEGGDPLPRLYGYEYLLLKRQNQDLDAPVQKTIERILDSPPQLFTDAFGLETVYRLPDGDTVYLYLLRHWPDPALPETYVAEAVQYLDETARPTDVLLLHPPELLSPLSQQGGSEAQIHLLPDGWASLQKLEHLSRKDGRLFVLLGERGNEIQNWLNRHAYRAADRWFGSLQVVLYGTTALPAPEQATQMSGVRFGEAIELIGTHLPGEEFAPGEVVPLTLFWQTRKPLNEDFKVFVHLLASRADGRPIAQRDSVRPTSTWGVNEPIVDRYGVLLPDDLSSGDYQLIVGLYIPDSGQRLLVAGNGATPSADHLAVGSIHVGP